VQRRREQADRSPYRIHAYILALGVYCTSWTYFGAVGSAATGGWNFLPIYLGPILLFALAPRFLERLTGAVHAEGATSLSDFIGSRFGKSRGVAALVTSLALFGTIPYVALQLRSVGTSWSLLAGRPGIVEPIWWAAVGLVIFAIRFGTQRYDVARRNEAVLFAVAAESVFKLFALGCVALFATLLFFGAPLDRQLAGLQHLRANFAPEQIDLDFVVVTLLSMMAIICLPRQFSIAVREARDPHDIVRARWPFIGYLTLTVLAVIPITLAGFALLPSTAEPDLYVLALPLSAGKQALAVVVFLGGVSAAVAMAVTETIALSIMVSNDFVAPMLLRRRGAEDAHFGQILLWTRRVAIIGVIAAAATYALMMPSGTQLASVGLIAFAAMAQSAPALILAVYRSGNDPLAAKAGLTTGLLLWAYTLFLPAIGSSLPLPGDGSLFNPTALLGLTGLNPIVHGTFWALGGNLLVSALVAARGMSGARLVLRPLGSRGIGSVANLGALLDMTERFVGAEVVREVFGPDIDREALVDRASARIAERMIAGVVGASSARLLMASALSGARLGVEDIAHVLDASGQSLRFSRGLLAATLENIDPGVSVIDRNLRLIAWNSRYLDLFNYPPGVVRVGAPVSELIRFNAERGDCGPGEVEDHVARRIDHMRQGHPHSFERLRPDGRVLKTVGGPMPDGGYVMCFTDITAEAEARDALVRARAELENRVVERTAELSEANEKLASAIADKTRFLAAASHDLLQPLHAARLFSAALQREVPDHAQQMLGRVDSSIAAANDLLRALLDISKLDAGGIVPHPTLFPVRRMLEELIESFEPLAAERGLTLRLGAGDALVEADRTLLRSIVQNFMSNAVRYTDKGGILVGVRRRGDKVRIEVFDTGPGIPPGKQRVIFREFERLGTNGEAGIGLGLAIVERTAPLVHGTVHLRSRPGRGSCFAVQLPLATGQVIVPELPVERITRAGGLRVLIVDDDLAICDAMASLLASRGHESVAMQSPLDALDLPGDFDVALVDFTLGDTMDGIDLADRLQAHRPALRIALITADQSAGMRSRAAARCLPILPKPLAPNELDDWLAQDGASAQAGE
jgi:signal transduction histidine kinase/Na+/proline symporter/CheY-like chemotaxis protein